MQPKTMILKKILIINNHTTLNYKCSYNNNKNNNKSSNIIKHKKLVLVQLNPKINFINKLKSLNNHKKLQIILIIAYPNLH